MKKKNGARIVSSKRCFYKDQTPDDPLVIQVVHMEETKSTKSIKRKVHYEDIFCVFVLFNGELQSMGMFETEIDAENAAGMFQAYFHKDLLDGLLKEIKNNK